MRIALIMARGTSTPVSYWLGFSLPELAGWVKTAADLAKEQTKNG
jgi:hypothetical protein